MRQSVGNLEPRVAVRHGSMLNLGHWATTELSSTVLSHIYIYEYKYIIYICIFRYMHIIVLVYYIDIRDHFKLLEKCGSTSSRRIWLQRSWRSRRLWAWRQPWNQWNSPKMGLEQDGPLKKKLAQLGLEDDCSNKLEFGRWSSGNKSSQENGLGNGPGKWCCAYCSFWTCVFGWFSEVVILCVPS